MAGMLSSGPRPTWVKLPGRLAGIVQEHGNDLKTMKTKSMTNCFRLLSAGMLAGALGAGCWAGAAFGREDYKEEMHLEKLELGKPQ